MKKVSLVVALLLLATTVYAADVTITATKVGAMNTAEPNHLQKVAIGFTGLADDNAISGFALNLNVDSNATMTNIADFNKGESKAHGGGFGIFPAKFRDVVNPIVADACFASDLRYTPLATWGDANCGWGNDTSYMVVELGTLWAGDNNKPALNGRGTLFTVDVNMEGNPQCYLTVTLEQIRGGVVKTDGTAATVTLPAPLLITDVPPTFIVSGKVAGAVAPRLGGIGGVTVNMGGTIVATDGAGNYSVVCSGPGTCTISDANNQWTFVPASFAYSGAMTQNVTGTAIECVNAKDVGYATWKTLGLKDCWCYKKQANGDTDGKATLGKNVVLTDLNTLKAAYNKTVSTLQGLLATQPNNICADFDHKATLSKPVVIGDLNILKAWYNKTGVPDGTGATINAWKN